MLNSAAFAKLLWILIDQAAGSEAELRRILATKSKAIIMAFGREFRRASDNIWRSIPVNDPDHSEDMLKDLYAQVVSNGKEFYDHIVRNPERILLDTPTGHPCYYGVAESVLWELYPDEMED